MKKSFCIFLCIFLFFAGASYLYAQRDSKETEKILSSAESVFKMMQVKNYKGIWDGITDKSRDTIVDDTYKAISKESSKNKKPMPYTKEMIRKDFSEAGSLSKEYWEAFLDNFDPITVLEQSTWKMGKIEGNKAEVVLQYRKSERPALLQMFKEKGFWRFGLVETFWTSIR